MKLNNLFPNTVIAMKNDIASQLLEQVKYYGQNKEDFTVDERLKTHWLLEELKEIQTYFFDYWNMLDKALEIEEIEKTVNDFLFNMIK